MATELMAEAFEPGDPRKDATLLYFRKSDSDPVTPEKPVASRTVGIISGK